MKGAFDDAHSVYDPLSVSPRTPRCNWRSVGGTKKALTRSQRAQSGALIRTGCLPCLRDGVRCNGSNPECHIRAASEDWRCNSDITWQWHGTWRERRGMHVFINFATSERTGLFESNFWHHTVMLACAHDKAVYHVASAIGALHEHILKRNPSRNVLEKNSDLEFALCQCNISIGILTANGTPQPDPGVVLITSILFAVFEALHGDPTQAIVHSLQGRKLLKHCERLAAAGLGSRFVDPSHVRPVIGGLEIQAKSLQGKAMQKSDRNDEPPLPDVARLHSLEHANSKLQYAYISLLVFCQDVPLDTPPKDMAIMMSEKYRIFNPWFKKWEEAFADLLFRQSGSLSTKDLQRARVLKANHIGASMLAAQDQGSARTTFKRCEPQFQAIIALSASVLDTYSVGPNATLSPYHYPYLSFGLWVAEPLFLTMSRSTNPETRRKAAGLLLGQAMPRNHRAKRSQGDNASSPSGSKGAEYRSRSDTDAWSIEQWIDFATSTRLDAGMAIYFGGFPEDYIDKPVYNAKCA